MKIQSLLAAALLVTAASPALAGAPGADAAKTAGVPVDAKAAGAGGTATIGTGATAAGAHVGTVKSFDAKTKKLVLTIGKEEKTFDLSTAMVTGEAKAGAQASLTTMGDKITAAAFSPVAGK